MIVLDLTGSLRGLILHEYHLLELIAELPQAHLFLFRTLESALFLVLRLHLFAVTPVLERLMDLIAEVPQADLHLERPFQRYGGSTSRYQALIILLLFQGGKLTR